MSIFNNQYNLIASGGMDNNPNAYKSVNSKAYINCETCKQGKYILQTTFGIYQMIYNGQTCVIGTKLV